MGLLVSYLVLALGVSFLCSLMEAVILSVPLSHVRIQQREGRAFAGLMEKLKLNIDRPLAAILSLNTIAHTIGAAGVGAQATRLFGEAYFGLVSAVLTILILILSEIIPKTIGASYSKQLTGFVAVSVRATIVMTYPLVIVSAFITRLFSKRPQSISISREEIAALASIGKDEGTFGDREKTIIQNIVRLKGIRVAEIMTPRVVVEMADCDMRLSDIPLEKTFRHFSRIPVYRGVRENVTGYVFRHEVYEQLAGDRWEMKLADLQREIWIVQDVKPVFSVWEELLRRKEHIALVVDEYGGMEGIVTMEDIIETLLGFEIVDETDAVADMRKYARERWEQRLQRRHTAGGDQQDEEG